MRIGSAVTIDAEGLDALIATLSSRGYETKGPVVRDGAILPGPVGGITDLPVGVRDVQRPGRYRLEQGEGDSVFSWAVGPGSWKAEFFPPAQDLWRSTLEGDIVTSEAPAVEIAPLAIVGARPCELAALAVLDRVLLDGTFTDPRYAARRVDAFVVAAECGSPASTCFCTSMGTGPATESDFDLALTELDDDDGHRFVVRVGTDRGADILGRVPVSEATPADMAARQAVLASATEAIDRRLETEGLAELLARNLDHPGWDDVAERCLACGNCTLVCPTCFCSDVSDTTDLTGEVRRQRTWASCFDLDHSYIHGGQVRSSISSRYRQWLTHKLSTWWDQFDSSGCVGCGRCIAWCPVGIDLTVEAAAIRASDGSLRSSLASGRDGR
jgi:sulfhydrogenase subunit beta (sulfur reductase)